MRCEWCSGEQITTNYEYYEYVSTHKSFHERAHVCMEEVNTDIQHAREDEDEVGKSRRGDRGGIKMETPCLLCAPLSTHTLKKRGKGRAQRSVCLSAARRSRSTPGGGVLVLRVLCGVGFESTRGNGRW